MDNPCEKTQDQLADYILGILSAEEVNAVSEHTGRCPKCRQYIQALKDENRILVQFGEDLEATMAARQDKVIEALSRSVPTARRKELSVWGTIMKSRRRKLVTAAVIAIAVLVPLSYGTAHVVKKFIIGSVGTDNCKGQFELGKDIYVELGIGTKEQPEIVTAGNIRFFVEDEQLKGTLRCRVRSWPKFKWQTRVELLDTNGDRLKHTTHVAENGGLQVGGYPHSLRRDVRFSLGQWSGVSQARDFKIRLERVSEKTEVTPDTWIESSELDIVHGRVVGPGGKGIPNAHVQIREKRKPGQRGIAAPDVSTDEQGCYSFDGIKWPYTVSVLAYETIPSGSGFRHQFKRLNKVLRGSQTVDFQFDKFPTGSAILSGTAETPNAETIVEFTVDVRSKADWEDFSAEYLYQFGCERKFAASDGKFEIADLPAGAYDISITPTTDDMLTTGDFLRRMEYVCELREGQKKKISAEDAERKPWYGRVLFEDGSAAVPDLPGLKTQIVVWGQDYTMGLTVATVDEDGCFMALMPDKDMEQLKSGKAWWTASISKVNLHHKVQKGERFPVELLSSRRDEAGVLRIARPKVYYGRILYENGRPAVPETAPWPGARVRAVLRYTPATSRSGGITEELADVDEHGCFAVLLTDMELKRIKDGELKIQIYHPSYEEERHSSPIGIFPAKMLSAERDSAKGYRLPYDEMSWGFRNLEQQLDSAETLRELASALTAYSADNDGRFPQSLGDLRANDIEESLAWAAEHVEYLGSAATAPAHERTDAAIAYDKTLLEKAGGTNVLFGDGHVEFCRLKKLEALGISR
jgi:prepilin-type processing-associated H-X9-DG protein